MSKDNDGQVQQSAVNEEINKELTGEELAVVAGGMLNNKYPENMQFTSDGPRRDHGSRV